MKQEGRSVDPGQCATDFSGGARTWLKSIDASLSSSISPMTALQWTQRQQRGSVMVADGRAGQG